MTAADLLRQDDCLRRAQAGDYTAFEALYADLEPGVARFVRRLLGDGMDAEDIVQDTFLALYMHLGRIESVAHLRPYAYRIARNACYDRLRQGRRAQLSLDDEATGGLDAGWLAGQLRDDASGAPDDTVHWLLLAVEVRAAIDQLPQAQRQTLILYAEAELNYAEIAQVMGVSIGTVRSRLFHARRTLRGLVRPQVLLALQDTPNQADEDDNGRDDTSQTQRIPSGVAGAATVD